MKDLLRQIAQKKQKLDKYKPLPEGVIKNLDEWYKVELTYTSNAIEGNTLSRAETALVMEKGITVDGKTITEHLEAVNHGKALEFVKTLSSRPISEGNILDIHRIILDKIDERYAGRYRDVPVRIRGSNYICPNPLKVPDLMDQFVIWLEETRSDIIKIAADTHYKFVSIHPFIDGNGRISRLLMNIILQKGGYPPAIIRKEDRRRYIDALEKAHMGGGLKDFYQIIYEAVDRSLDIYLQTLESRPQKKTQTKHKLLKIGDLAKLSNETTVTIRYWTNEGLLKVEQNTPGGYRLYSVLMVEQIKKINKLKKDRLTLEEIKEKLDL